MLKKTITYTNPFTDEEVSEDHYFHISKADLVEMQMESLKEPKVTDPATGEELEGYRAKLQRIINSEDGTAILEIVKEMMRRSYGKKDGDRFVKNVQVWRDFEASEAYSQMYFELCTDAETQAAFMNGIMPRELEQEAAVIAARAAHVSTTGHPSDTAAQPAPEPPDERATITAEREIPSEPTLAEMLEQATPENPYFLSPREMLELDSDDLKSGLATGRYKLS